MCHILQKFIIRDMIPVLNGGIPYSSDPGPASVIWAPAKHRVCLIDGGGLARS